MQIFSHQHNTGEREKNLAWLKPSEFLTLCLQLLLTHLIWSNKIHHLILNRQTLLTLNFIVFNEVEVGFLSSLRIS